MPRCVHERVCTEYMRRYGKILSKHCPNPSRCPFYQKENSVTIKEFMDDFMDGMADTFCINDNGVTKVKRKTVPRDMVDDCYGV